MEKKCELCNRDMLLKTNLSGLVYDDKHFLCEKCHDNHSDEELYDWIKTKMKDPKKGMPISLWLIHEQNKDKTFMTRSLKK
jgi:transposase-like protein